MNDESDGPTGTFLDQYSRYTRIFVTVALFLVVPALLDRLLITLGYELLGMAVWIVGYIGGALVVWYLWLRKIDFTGESTQPPLEEEE